MRRRRPTDRADVLRYSDQANDNAIGEPEFALSVQVSGEPAQFRARGTTFEREGSGERVHRPPRVAFNGDVDVQDGDVVRIDLGDGTAYEDDSLYGDDTRYGYEEVREFDVVGRERTFDSRSEQTLTTIVDLAEQ